MTAQPLADLAHAVLGSLVAYWPSIPDADAPDLLALPDRRYVTIGTAPIADCEQLVVSVERTFGTQGNPAREEIVPLTTGTPWLRTAVFQIQILRCVPVIADTGVGPPTPPTPAQIDAAGAAILADADTILACLILAHKNGDLGGCGELALENWRAIGEQGGFAGGASKIRINLF